MRLRPILMTSLALSSALCRWLSVLVLVPARRSSGYRCNGRDGDRNGTGNLLVPVFFVVVRRRFSRKNEDIDTAILSIIIDTTCNH